MGCYFDVCVETINFKSESERLKNLGHTELESCTQTKHTMKNSDFFDMDENSNVYITNHNKKHDIYLFK